jgi:hypothetical protein
MPAVFVGKADLFEDLRDRVRNPHLVFHRARPHQGQLGSLVKPCVPTAVC